jgi:hypothetical protein
MLCPDCSSDIHPFSEKCQTCGLFAGYPNVRAADEPGEVAALEARYEAARRSAADDGRLSVLDTFEQHLAHSCAVINTKVDFLRAFLINPKTLHSTYSLGVKGQIRILADPDNDQERRTVEAKLFGAYAEEIRYAVLSMDGASLSSYGAIALRLRDVAVVKRASLLEENSYDFVDHHGLLPKVAIPRGYRCSWPRRPWLGVAKLAGMIRLDTTESEFQDILLYSEGDRSKDRFIEVHIYGPFDASAIESVRGKTPTKGKQDRAEIARVKELLVKRGCPWVEDA